jgi:hypothetical protein
MELAQPREPPRSLLFSERTGLDSLVELVRQSLAKT